MNKMAGPGLLGKGAFSIDRGCMTEKMMLKKRMQPDSKGFGMTS